MRDPAAPRASTLPGRVTSLYLWGSNRALVNRLATGAAQGMDPRFARVEVSDSHREGGPQNRAELGIAAPVRAFAPPRGVSAEVMRKSLRQNGQRREVEELDSFLRMSEPIQKAIGLLLQRETPRVLLLANLERLRPLFCPEEAGQQPFISWLNDREITLVASSTGAPLREGIHFDYLATQPDTRRNGVRPPVVAISQRGDPDSRFLRQIFRPNEVVWLSGLSPSALPTRTSVASLART